MASRIIFHNQYTIYRQHLFLSSLSASRFHYHRHYYHNSHDHHLTTLVSCPIVNHDDDKRTYTNSYFLNRKKMRKSQISLYYHSKYYFNNTEPNQIREIQTKIKPETNLKSERKRVATQKKNILQKSANITYNICYYTFDSIISPKRGYERICRVWIKLKEHASHFWSATKLMWTDIKSARRILRKLRRGKELTYRERRQLRRVTMDALKFVPMVIIVMIPFLEAALPFLLYMFPNMLPSRFQSEHMKLEKRKKLLSARIGLAAFFEDTLHEYVKEQKLKSEVNTELFDILLSKMRNNEEISNEQILRVASLFDDEIALDNASHSVLSNMCRYMDLNTFGTTAMLRSRLYVKIREIRREDQGIRKEGLDNIPESLLKQLLRERGMRSDFQEWVLRGNLTKWLELSLDNDVPVSLLVMSRIFTLQHIPGQDTTDRLKDAISTIGDATTKEMLVEKGGIDDLKTEKEIIERQQQLIDEEEELIDAIEDKRHIRDLAESVETLASDSVVDAEKQDILEMREKLKEINDEICEEKSSENKLSKRIDKMIEKSSIYADETGNKFENTLKRLNDENERISDDELKYALKDTLSEYSKFSDEQIDEFLKELQYKKEQQPNIKLSKVIEKLIDDYEQDIDIKDIDK